MLRAMKNAILNIALLLSSFPVHAAYQSQTLLRLEGQNGLIQTLPAVTVGEFNVFTAGVKDPMKVKDAALLYDKRNPLPAMTSVGANYAFFAGGSMATVSENGSFYYKGKMTIEPGALGGVYFLNKASGEIIAIDSSGFYNFTGVIAKNIRIFGGNFLIDQAGVLTTIKHMGTAAGNPMGMVTAKTGWSFNDVVRAGGNFMVKVDGSIVTVDSENGFFSMPQKVESRAKQLGGNYFIAEDKTLYTISDKGEVLKQMPVIGEMVHYGYSYMIDADGDFIFVDGKGIPHTEMVQVSTTGIQSKIVKQIGGKLDIHQNFIPAQQ